MKVLMVVDMLNAFAYNDGETKGALFSQGAKDIIPFVLAKIKEAYENEYHIIFLCDAHDEDDKEFDRFGVHAIKDTWEAQLIDEILSYIKEINEETVYHDSIRIHIVNKTRYSGFYRTVLDNVIAQNELAEATFEFIGVCTGICDMDTIADFANRDMKTAIYRKGVADLPHQAYGLDDEDLNIKLEAIWLKRMEFLYGTKIL